MVFTPFNRYEADVSWFKFASSEYRFENRYNLNPKDYNTTEEEIDWYLGAIVYSIVISSLILFIFVWENRGLHKWLKSINRDMFFPSILPNVESFLTEYQRREEEYYASKK